VTTKAELSKLFNYDAKTPRISAFAASVAIAHDNGDVIMAMFSLLHPKTKKRTDKWLGVALSPGDAMRLAKTIQAYAERKKWPQVPLGEFFEVRIGETPKTKMN
jgi:hypothetical protein